MILKEEKKYNKMKNKESEIKKLNKKNSKLNKKIKEYEDLIIVVLRYFHRTP